MTTDALRRRTLVGGACATLIVATAVSAPARAQQSEGALEEVVVTAERRSENLQETPISIAAFTTRALDTRGINNLQNITNFAPNVEISATKRPAGGSTAIAAFIRGVGTGDFQIPTDPAIGLYVDGVYIARTIGGLLSIADIERIEVLKGPQGTLFGRNTLGGAISVITSQPKLDGDATGKLEVRLGDYGRRDAIASINGALIPGVLGAKFSLSTLNFDGWQKNLINDTRYGKEGRTIARASTLWNVSDAFDVQFTGDYTRQRQNGVNGQLLSQDPTVSANIRRFNQFAAPVLAPGLNLPAGTLDDNRWATASPRVTYETAPNTDNADIWGLSAIATYTFSEGLRFKSTTAYRDLDSFIQVAGDGSPFPANQAASSATSTAFSQEFELSGVLFSDRVNYVLGAYYFDEDADASREGYTFHGVYAVTRTVSDARDRNEFYTLAATSYAGFAQVDVEVFPRINAIVGVRVNHDKKDYSANLTRPEVGDTVTPYTLVTNSWTSTTPRFGLNWKATDGIFVYASYAQGFKSGGFGTPADTGGIPSYDPEKLKTYELGVKTNWFDNRMTLNLAGFHSIYDGVQITVVVPPSLRTVQNGGTAQINGFEADLEAAPFGGAFRVNASVGHNHARFVTVSPGAVAASASNGLQHVPGTRLPYVPDNSYSVGAQYSFNVGEIGKFTVRSDASYKSETNLTLADPTSAQGGYALFNARVTYEPSFNDRVEFSLQGTNLGDKTYYYYRNRSSTTGNNLAQGADPRLIYLQGRYSF